MNIKFIFSLATVSLAVSHAEDTVRDYFASFDFSWDAASMYLTTEEWFMEPTNSGLIPYLTQERIRPSCDSFLNSPVRSGGNQLARQFSHLADCLDSNAFMQSKPDERDGFIEALGKTACRMRDLVHCARQPARSVFFPNHRAASCTLTNTIKALAKTHNLMECVININAAK